MCLLYYLAGKRKEYEQHQLVYYGSYILVFNHLKMAKVENISTDCFNKHTSVVKARIVILLRQNNNFTNIYSYHKPNYKHYRGDHSTDHLKKLYRGDSVL